MHISITDRNKLLNKDLRELCERRLDFALSRFESSIKKIDLVIVDENGPRGGVDKACRICISLHRASDVVINEKAEDVATCVSGIAERASRTVARALERTQQFDRTQKEVHESI
ncbi:HPF/RaiA family ribosome-associated protein [Gimesia aquarii]|uniref:Sigma 54 modulation protein / S30EA ribosomal protein n=1 Tax=Gimesia aquarii TaxID=2527964 RepID=A0A517WXE6_9PLAN|nr:HPF/RaiA family ribosome-associated protein [Gimesia aquarii]QDU09892.1 hypothetical protein V202x_32890 [Gimesia aquarii]